MQHTLSHIVTISGIGLHSGAETTLVIKPALPNTGIYFVRRDVTDRNNVIPARYDHVMDTRMCTVIGNHDGVTVGTIEHVMAALASLAIDNAVIELDGPEVPIMDGSSEPFITAIRAVGIKAQTATRRAIKILKEISVTEGDKHVTLKPSVGSVYAVNISFAHPCIGNQSYELDLLQDGFDDEISSARTFGFVHEVKALRAQGLALGGSMDNAVVLDHERVLNEEGLRFADEFVRHKLLDAVGDIYLAGAPILGRYEGLKGGHALNNQILRALFAASDCYTVVDLFSTDQAVQMGSFAPIQTAIIPSTIAAE
jgi:UDP-3-O-[3-hydroxymyristoyl] N-acetylglucosamine deacetylase